MEGAEGITSGPGRDTSIRKSNSFSAALCNLKGALVYCYSTTTYANPTTSSAGAFCNKKGRFGLTSSASSLGGTGGGVTVIRFLAIGGGAVGRGGGGVSGKGMKPRGLCPPKPAV